MHKYSLFFITMFIVALPIGVGAVTYSNALQAVPAETPSGSATGTIGLPPVKAGPALLEIDTIKGESPEKKKGNVEVQFKVEEGQKATTPSIEPDEIDVADDGEPVTPDFGILLGGGTDQNDDGAQEREEGLERAIEILSVNAKASDTAIESVSLNFEKISTRIRHKVKLFGFIPAKVAVTVDIDTDEKVRVSYPWWAFFSSGKDSDALGQRTFMTLANVLRANHDTIKNSINNIR